MGTSKFMTIETELNEKTGKYQYFIYYGNVLQGFYPTLFQASIHVEVMGFKAVYKF